jgi:CRISPR/Cas system-associated exonuclease Cas4 (RecB family)
VPACGRGEPDFKELEEVLMSGFFGVKIQKRQPIVAAIRAAVAAKRRPVAARDRVYASEISACDRRITFALLGCEPDAPRADSPSALLGDAIHMHLEALLVEAFPGRVETEVRVVGGAVSGRIDALLIEDDNTLTVIDIKTVSAKEWAARSKLEEYIDQISIYAALVEAQTGVVLLVNRDTGEMEEMRFAIDRARAEALLYKALRLQSLALDGYIAEAVAWGTEECRWCPFRKRCDSLDKTGVLAYTAG